MALCARSVCRRDEATDLKAVHNAVMTVSRSPAVRATFLFSGPVLCATDIHPSLTPSFTTIPAAHVHFSQAPAQCVEHSVQSKRKPQLVVDVCKGASSVAPAECLDLLPQNLPLEAAVGLCSGAKGVGPAVCTNARDQLRNGPDITVKLCRGASGQGPADCFRRSALATALSTDERVGLCIGARTDAPARCDLTAVCGCQVLET